MVGKGCLRFLLMGVLAFVFWIVLQFTVHHDSNGHNSKYMFLFQLWNYIGERGVGIVAAKLISNVHLIFFPV